MTMNDLIDNFKNSPYHEDTFGLLELCMREAPKAGLVLEFGVGGGSTIRCMAKQTQSTVYGFDSFRGLPERWNEHNPCGMFDNGGVPPANLPPNVRLFSGLFTDTVPTFFAETPGPVAFAHIDCDLYSSASVVLREMAPHIVDGTVLNFDEFFNYPEDHLHEARAFFEFLQETGYGYECFGRCGHAYTRAAFRMRVK